MNAPIDLFHVDWRCFSLQGSSNRDRLLNAFAGIAKAEMLKWSVQGWRSHAAASCTQVARVRVRVIFPQNHAR